MSGRPKVYTDEQELEVRASVRLAIWHKIKAKRLGGGSLSDGVRIAIEQAEFKEKRTQ